METGRELPAFFLVCLILTIMYISAIEFSICSWRCVQKALGVRHGLPNGHIFHPVIGNDMNLSMHRCELHDTNMIH